ncbi:hypothetical protein BMETH_2270_0 [methanotrophic bacterial endosymbiont of Bathymodiolus sp.]|nr:hypothetical protein BMETH_2270_0 [methanotrophic bacterial endosymbiont of Bathymodiolus sp.]
MTERNCRLIPSNSAINTPYNVFIQLLLRFRGSNRQLNC